MRRALVAALASASLLAPAALSATAAEARSVPLSVCEYEWQRGARHIKQLVRCAARRWSVPGGAVKAIEVADCESHLNPGVRSSSGSYAGLYQQSTRYWPSRATGFGQGDRSVLTAGQHHRLDPDGARRRLVEHMGRLRLTLPIR